MPAAPCPYCGNQVMPYSRYALHLKRGATCASCGREVRVRGYVLALVTGLLLAAAVIAYFILGDRGLRETLLVIGTFGIVAVVVDYTFWRRVGFGPGADDAGRNDAAARDDAPAAHSSHPAERDAGRPTGA